jgi:predicted transcriptional regulator
MKIRLLPEQEARLAAVAARTGRSTEELVQEAVALWEEREAAQDHRGAMPKHTPAEAAARIRELRKGNFLPEGETIEDLIRHGRA